MIYAYIGVTVIVALLIGFATLAIVWLARSVGRSIRRRTMELVSAYDDLLEERSQQLARMEQKQKKAVQAPPAAPEKPKKTAAPVRPADTGSAIDAVSRVAGAAYRDGRTGSLYQKIRRGFCFSPDAALANLPAECRTAQKGPAGLFLQEISFDTVYALSTLPEKEQLQLLTEHLEPPQRQLVQEYQNTHPRFNCLDFYDYLRQTADAEPKKPVLRVAPAVAVQTPREDVTVVVDPAICEGFELEAGSRVYDYSIKVREIS